MFPTAVPPRARIAALAIRARNIVDSGLCTRTTGVPDWLIRSEQLERLAAAPAPVRLATIARYDDAVVVDLLVLSYLRHGTPYRLWADTPGGFAQDVLRGLNAAAAGRELEFFGPQHLRAARRTEASGRRKTRPLSTLPASPQGAPDQGRDTAVRRPGQARRPVL